MQGNQLNYLAETDNKMVVCSSMDFRLSGVPNFLMAKHVFDYKCGPCQHAKC